MDTNMTDADKPITSNDRVFTCSDYGSSFGLYLNQKSNIIVNTSFLNVQDVQNNLTSIINNVTVAHNTILKWLTDMEYDFSTKINLGNVNINMDLFNKLNTLIPQIGKARKILDTWLSNFIFSASFVSENLNNYSNFAGILENIKNDTSLNMGFGESVVSIAKKNRNHSKSITRIIAKLKSIDMTIRKELGDLQFKMQELSSGIIRYDERKVLNLTSIFNAIKSLSGIESPLVKVQSDIAKIINSTPIVFNLSTTDIPKMPDLKLDAKFSAPAPRMTADDFLTSLKIVKDSMLYTSSTENRVRQLREVAQNVYMSSSLYPEMINILDSIVKENNPNVIFTKLNTNAVIEDNIFDTIRTINSFLNSDTIYDGNLIYKQKLENILLIASQTARNLISKG